MSDTGLVCTVTVAVVIGLFHRLGRSWHGHIRDALIGGVAASAAYVGVVQFRTWYEMDPSPSPSTYAEIVGFVSGLGIAIFAMLGYMAFEEYVCTLRTRAHDAARLH